MTTEAMTRSSKEIPATASALPKRAHSQAPSGEPPPANERPEYADTVADTPSGHQTDSDW